MFTAHPVDITLTNPERFTEYVRARPGIPEQPATFRVTVRASSPVEAVTETQRLAAFETCSA